MFIRFAIETTLQQRLPVKKCKRKTYRVGQLYRSDKRRGEIILEKRTWNQPQSSTV